MEKGAGVYSPEDYSFVIPETKKTIEQYENFFAENPGIQDTIWWLLKPESERTGHPTFTPYYLARRMAAQKIAYKAIMNFIVETESKNAAELSVFLAEQVDEEKEFERELQTEKN